MNQTFHTPTRWDLKSLYPNESGQMLPNEVKEITELIHTLKEETDFILQCEQFINESMLQTLSNVQSRLKKAEYYCYCLASEIEDHSSLDALRGKINTLKNEAQALFLKWQQYIINLPTDKREEWYSFPFVKAFLNEFSKNNFDSFNNETVNHTKNELHHWQSMYAQLIRTLEIELADENTSKYISFSEATHIAMNHDNPTKRTKAFNALTNKLHTEKDSFANALNNIAQLRISQTDALQQEDILADSLSTNGISKKALFTMWQTIDDNSNQFTSFLDSQKKEEEELTWYELMTSKQHSQEKIPFSKAIEDICNSLRAINDEMAQFILHAINNGWVDAEQRHNKPIQGFCAPFFQEGESRISLQYDGTIESARILAHELGHAWHFKQLKDNAALSSSATSFPMSLAECASILFEVNFINHLLTVTDDLHTKNALLHYKIKSSLNYVMSIRGAFIFEQRFYEKSKDRKLTSTEIEELSIQSQKVAYNNHLKQYQPFVWIKYGQFYEPNIPFYNYPYTFGYLLSIGLLTIAKQEGCNFHKKYKQFLGETRKKSVEELVYEHFRIDLCSPAFWQQAVNQIVTDMEEYAELQK